MIVKNLNPPPFLPAPSRTEKHFSLNGWTSFDPPPPAKENLHTPPNPLTCVQVQTGFTTTLDLRLSHVQTDDQHGRHTRGSSAVAFPVVTNCTRRAILLTCKYLHNFTKTASLRESALTAPLYDSYTYSSSNQRLHQVLRRTSERYRSLSARHSYLAVGRVCHLFSLYSRRSLNCVVSRCIAPELYWSWVVDMQYASGVCFPEVLLGHFEASQDAQQIYFCDLVQGLFAREM